MTWAVPGYQKHFAAHLCRNWDRRHDEALESFDIVLMYEEVEARLRCDGTQENRAGAGIQVQLKQVISLDLRSLALFRIGLGLFTTGDILHRIPDIRALYIGRRHVSPIRGYWRIRQPLVLVAPLRQRCAVVAAPAVRAVRRRGVGSRRGIPDVDGNAGLLGARRVAPEPE